MADILIKGMEMPKCCDECPMSQLINDNQYAYCNILRKGTKAGYILKACPLEELPPHGRLVSADEVQNKMSYYGFHAIDMTIHEFIEDELTTIVEANT